MQNNVGEQIRFLLVIIASGMGCSLVYDIIRARRKLFNLGNICVNIEDIIFCVFTGIIFLTVTFYLNSGIIRISGFFGIISGELLYFFLIRNRMRNFFIFLAKQLFKIFTLFLKIVVFPAKLINRLFRKPVYIAAWYVGGYMRKFKYKLRISGNIAKNHIKIINIFVRKRGGTFLKRLPI